MTRTRIKCCGMTCVEDALLAARLGVDAIGLVFTRRSRRCVALQRAREIRDALPPFVTSVALFMDDDAAFVREVVAAVDPGLLQFHGAEDDAWCTQFGLPYLKALAMGGEALPDLARWPGAAALLLDGHVPGAAGGAGKAFDWARVPRGITQPLVLAGGLSPHNVAEAVRRLRPWAVDVASGVESAPGVKDAARLAAFVAAVRAADAQPA